ncbi:MAG: antibiotic biosynthesis monooxygenase [Oscillospiraceae bacterium]|jgi:quinol monooxygenase YgiN|nr:antibiotic biosynthesis monooxygenase [Oscillospiraceae bacterium]
MRRVVANSYIKQDSVDEFLAVAKELVEKTNALDPGCISYALYQDTQDPLHYTMIEEWEDEESINRHMSSPHAADLIPKMTQFASRPGEVAIYKKAVG